MAEPRPLLEVRGVAKHFGGVAALRGIDVAARAGEIHALLGQNGAGKSTLVKILNGVHPAGSFAGEIVPKNTSVQLHISAKVAQQVKVPNLAGLTLAEAKAQLEALGLAVGDTNTLGR